MVCLARLDGGGLARPDGVCMSAILDQLFRAIQANTATVDPSGVAKRQAVRPQPPAPRTVPVHAAASSVLRTPQIAELLCLEGEADSHASRHLRARGSRGSVTRVGLSSGVNVNVPTILGQHGASIGCAPPPARPAPAAPAVHESPKLRRLPGGRVGRKMCIFSRRRRPRASAAV